MSRHLSSEQISAWIIGERTAEEQRHVAECVLCRSEVERLEKAFSLFRDSGRRWSDHWYASPNNSGGRPARWRPWRLATLLAVAISIGIVLIRSPQPELRRSSEEPFVEFPFVAPPAPYERTAVMRMDVPVATLIAAGFEVHVPDTGAAITADVWVGQDGRALAIRYAPSVNPNSDRRLQQ